MFKQSHKLIFLTFICFVICSCRSWQTSSGFQSGIPKRVGVSLFTGDAVINQQATEQFSAGLLKLGFDVIERNQFQAVINELDISSTDLFLESTRATLGKQLGLEGLFVGNVTGRSTPSTCNTFLTVKLVDIQTGKVVWAGNFSDPRIFSLTTDVKTSIVFTTKEALKKLKKDIAKRKHN